MAPSGSFQNLSAVVAAPSCCTRCISVRLPHLHPTMPLWFSTWILRHRGRRSRRHQRGFVGSVRNDGAAYTRARRPLCTWHRSGRAANECSFSASRLISLSGSCAVSQSRPLWTQAAATRTVSRRFCCLRCGCHKESVVGSAQRFLKFDFAILVSECLRHDCNLWIWVEWKFVGTLEVARACAAAGLSIADGRACLARPRPLADGCAVLVAAVPLARPTERWTTPSPCEASFAIWRSRWGRLRRNC